MAGCVDPGTVKDLVRDPAISLHDLAEGLWKLQREAGLR